MDLISEATSGNAEPGYRALVVDDEAALADVIASYLRRDHFEVTVCHTGAEALAVAREVDPDVVVLDLGLPGSTDSRSAGNCGSSPTPTW